MPALEDQSPHDPLPPAYKALLTAVERGRAGRSQRRAQEWAHVRALGLALTLQGLSRVRIGGGLGLSTQRITQLREEACEAVLRGGAKSPKRIVSVSPFGRAGARHMAMEMPVSGLSASHRNASNEVSRPHAPPILTIAARSLGWPWQIAHV